MNSRRNFLKQVGATGAASLVALGTRPQALFARAAKTAAVDPDGRILVLVQLVGGNDGLNTVIPFGDDIYRRQRPSLGFGKSKVLRLNDQLGLHPQMNGFKELFDVLCAPPPSKNLPVLLGGFKFGYEPIHEEAALLFSSSKEPEIIP